MNSIQKNYWNRFKAKKDNKDRYDGIKFEKLVNHLLKLMYGVSWHKTKKSHDNNRDFWIILDDEKIWAECKNYKDPIAMNILAPTLVMAQIYETNTILFFSRSRINDKAKDKILAFGEKTEKAIKFYDGKILESLIKEYANLLPKKYMPSFEMSDNGLINYFVSIYFFQDAFKTFLINDDEFINYSYANKIRYNEAFCLKIVITNPYLSKSIRVVVSFLKDDSERFKYQYLNNNISSNSCEIDDFILNQGEGKSLSINMRAIIFAPVMSFPIINVKLIDDEKIIKQWNSKKVFVKCSWIGKTKLIGNQYHQILDTVNNELVDNSNFSLGTIIGSSGTGKSRILNECSGLYLSYGYKILNLTSNSDFSSIYLIKEIIYFLYELPKSIITKELEKKVLKTTGKKTDASNVAIHMLTEINNCFIESEITKFIDNYGDIIFEKLSQSKNLILIDNIQFANSSFHYFIENYINYSANQNRSNYSVLICVFNEDYMTSKTSELLYKFYNSNVQNCHDFAVKGFKYISQGILFLRELIKTDNEEYDEFFTTIIKNVSLNPYYLYQTVKLLEEEGSIKISNDNKGYIFLNEITSNYSTFVYKNIVDVLNKRWQYIIDEFSQADVNLIFSTIYLFDCIDDNIIKEFNINENILKNLCKKHLIKSTKDNHYEFDHDIIRNYFETEHRSNITYCLVQNNVSVDFLISYSIPYAIYNFKIVKNIDFILETCKKIKQFKVPNRMSKIYYEELFYACIENYDFFDNDIVWINCLQNICVNLRSVCGSKVAKLFYSKVMNIIDTKYSDYTSLYSYPFRQLVHSYCDILLELHLRNDVETLANNIIMKCTDNKQLSDEQQDENYVLQAILLNRLYVSYNNAELTTEIENKRKKYMQESRDKEKNIKNEKKRRLITYLNDSDEGYNFYGYLKDKDKLFNLWNRCIQDIPKLAPEKTLNYYRKLIQYGIINHDYNEVMDNISKGQEYLASGEFSHEPLIFNTFFKMSEAMANVQSFPKEKHYYIVKLINEVIKIQELLKNGKMGDIYTLKGIDSFYANDIEGVYYSFKNAYDDYLKRETSRYWIKIDLLLENIHFSFSKLDLYHSHFDISFLPEKYQYPLSSNNIEAFNASGIQRTNDNKMNLPLFN